MRYDETVIDTDVCEQPMNKGTGTSQLPRWHFDIGSNGCEEFTYTGLKGNENNFISKQTCEERCPGKP